MRYGVLYKTEERACVLIELVAYVHIYTRHVHVRSFDSVAAAAAKCVHLLVNISVSQQPL